MALHLLGIRHHGPGSAKNVLETLAALKPDIILIEGPPEGEIMIPWVTNMDMKPPVALLAYVPDNPKQAAFYPFTSFSPEWNAIIYALENKVPLRFIDMPLAHSFALKEQHEKEIETEAIEINEADIEISETNESIRRNPLSYFAEIEGFEDAEEWWEQRFEINQKPENIFEAIEAIMVELRGQSPKAVDETEALREAFMRKAIRTAQREMFTEIAVVCGAWHVPALRTMPKQKDDEILLKGLPKVKVETTWIPWTNDRLSSESGYGAGIDSPGWYGHSWNNPTDNGAIWLSHTAAVFRKNQIDISSAHIIESVLLANALAGIRTLSRPGLKEFNEATLAVMCMGDPVFMQLIHRELIVGHELGQVPEGAPQVPIQKDFDQLIKKYRLKLSNEAGTLTLDLREDNDLQKSVFLHRLQLLDVDWGELKRVNSTGTFKEEWLLCWYPELAIKLLEKAPYGNTVEAAANNYLQDNVSKCTRLDEITVLVKKALPANLATAIQYTMKRLDELAAGTSDTLVLIDAFVPLVQVSRYGNVRKTDLETVTLILTSIFYRIIVGLPISCTGIDEEQAAIMVGKIKNITQLVNLLEDAEIKAAWIETIGKIVAMQNAAPMVQGCSCKILYDTGALGQDAVAAEFSKALSTGNTPDFSSNWLEGFLKDAAAVLILDDNIWNIVNNWMASLEESVFLEIIPLLRRTFAVYSNVEKRKIATRASSVGSKPSSALLIQDIDVERAVTVFPLLEMLMGL